MLRIHDELFEMNDPGLAAALSSIYGTKTRPVCNCQPDGVEMYIAKVVGKFAVKRMPNTGSAHAPGCDSFEPPAELSGIGQLLGSAIEEDTDEGLTTLKLGYSLTKVAGRTAPSPSASEKSSVKTDGHKLTLRGTLHYLWEQAGFNRWSPSMEGKRSWAVIRKYLLLAAENKVAKRGPLAERLYIPEAFNLEKKAEIAQRRVSRFAKLSTPAKDARELIIVIGQVSEIGTARFGYKIKFKHVPDCDFMMNEDIHKRMQTRFAPELELWNSSSDSGVHLIAIGTVGVGYTGVPSIEEIALMVVSSGWVPVESRFDLMLLDTLNARKRRFVKGLRYNLPSTIPLAAVVLSDTSPKPTAVYIVLPNSEEEYIQRLNAIIDNSELLYVKWDLNSGQPVDLPEPFSSTASSQNGLTAQAMAEIK